LRDAAFIRFGVSKELLITTDCCTGVGELPDDYVYLEIEEVAKITCRVALMELLSLKCEPIGYSFNYTGDIDKYVFAEKGFVNCFQEFGYNNIPFISSSENNFKPLQTSIAVSITGLRKIEYNDNYEKKEFIYAIIGEPLCGEEVIKNAKAAISTKEFIALMKIKDIEEIIPLGSGGAIEELEKRFVKVIKCDLDLNKSAGPATCVLIVAKKNAIDYLIHNYKDKLHIIYSESIDKE